MDPIHTVRYHVPETEMQEPGASGTANTRTLGSINKAAPATANTGVPPATSFAGYPVKSVAPPAVAPTPARRLTYLERHPEYARRGWSRGKRICCGLCLLLLVILIVVGIIIAFLVRVPSVEYKDVKFICSENNYVACAQNEVQVLVYLTVVNPNIIGATVNAKLGLYDESEKFLGPGVVDDTSVRRKGNTDITALFNITSATALPIVTALFVPPQRSVTVHLRGTVYIHVGLLRPSISVSQSITIPPQNAQTVIGGLLGRMRTPNTLAADADVDALVPDSAADLAPSSQQPGDSTSQRFNARAFSRALQLVGAPGSPERAAFEQRQQQQHPQRPSSSRADRLQPKFHTMQTETPHV